MQAKIIELTVLAGGVCLACLAVRLLAALAIYAASLCAVLARRGMDELRFRWRRFRKRKSR